MIGRVEQAKTAWYEAHQEITTFLLNWVGPSTAKVLASGSCGLWIRRAMDGFDTTTGPYGLLYAIAYELVKLSPNGMFVPNEYKAQDFIPLDTRLLPYQLSKLYVDSWKAARLLGWDRQTINRVTRALSAAWPTSQWEWAELEPEMISRLAPGLASCAFDVLSVHECLDCDICSEASARWEQGDIVTERWFTGRRLTMKEE